MPHPSYHNYIQNTRLKVPCFVEYFLRLVEKFLPIKVENILPCFKIFSHFQTKCTGGRIITDQEMGGEKAVSEYVLELKGITKIFPRR